MKYHFARHHLTHCYLYIFLGCDGTCNGMEQDSYSIAGDVCGSKFKRCANGQTYIENCKSDDVFNPYSDYCVCVPRAYALWCAAGASVAEVCNKSCISSTGP